MMNTSIAGLQVLHSEETRKFLQHSHELPLSVAHESGTSCPSHFIRLMKESISTATQSHNQQKSANPLSISPYLVQSVSCTRHYFSVVIHVPQGRRARRSLLLLRPSFQSYEGLVPLRRHCQRRCCDKQLHASHHD